MSILALVDLWGSPGDASSIAPKVDLIFWTLCLVSTLLVVGLLLVNGWFLIKYRRGSPAYRGPLPIASWKVEATWITATTVAFLAFFFWGAHVYLEMERTPADAYQITMVGRQWMWDVRHSNSRARPVGNEPCPSRRRRLKENESKMTWTLPSLGVTGRSGTATPKRL